ncbi:MAG: hypothetical protein V8S24_08535 [Gordonibacter pamelaeae]
MPANNIHREHWFERHISDHLDESWRVSNTDEGFDKVNALYMPDFLEFFEKADPEKAAKYKNQHGGEWRKRLERALVKSLEKDGTILTLQKGFALAGFQTICCMAPYPDDPRIKGARGSVTTQTSCGSCTRSTTRTATTPSTA